MKGIAVPPKMSPRRFSLSFAIVLSVATSGVFVGSSAAASCSNEQIRQQQGTTYLPQCMALELISPGGKFGAYAVKPMISADGEKVLFQAKAALGDTPGYIDPVNGDTYVTSRTSSGWKVTPMSPPASYETGGEAIGVPKTFSADLDRWLSIQATLTQWQGGRLKVLEASLQPEGPEWLERSPLLAPLDGLVGVEIGGSAGFQAVSSDWSSLFLSPGTKPGLAPVAYLPGDPRPTGNDQGARNVYVLSDEPSPGSVALLTRDEVGPDAGKAWGGNCGAWVGGGGFNAQRGGRNQGALSTDGSRSYISARPGQPQPLAGEPAKPACVLTAAGTATTTEGSTALTNVATAKGTGTTADGSNQVTDLTATSGSFLIGQTISIPAVTLAPGTTITAISGTALSPTLTLSNPVTAGGGAGKALEAGAEPFAAGQRISGAGIPAGTTVAAVSGREITLSAAATANASGVSISAPANPIRILEREETPSGVQISELIASECSRVSPTCDPAEGNDFYEGASVDGSKVYFTTTRQLADSDLDSGTECDVSTGVTGCDLYLYDAEKPVGQRLTQVSAGEATVGHPTVGSGAGVYKSIAAISGDGSRAYFIASGVLTESASPAGLLPQGGQPNLYLYEADSGATKFIGTLAAGDAVSGFLGNDISFWRDARAVPLRGADLGGQEVGGDGHILVLSSKAPLTADDLDGGRADVFRYDGDTETLERVSKAAPGGSDNGPFDAVVYGANGIPAGEFAERARWVSEDGDSVGFMTAEALVPVDADGDESPYMWRQVGVGSELTLLPGNALIGFSGPEEFAPTLSADGNEVAFVSSRALLPADGDATADVYVARAEGGFPNPPPSPVCIGEACQGPPSPAPTLQGAASGTYAGKGNVKPAKKHKPKKQKKKHKAKKHKAKKRSGSVKRGGAQ